MKKSDVLLGLISLSTIFLPAISAQADQINYGTVNIKLFQCPDSADPGNYEITSSSLTLNSVDNNHNYSGILPGLINFVARVIILHPEWQWNNFAFPINNQVNTPVVHNVVGVVSNTIGGIPTQGAVTRNVFNVGSLDNQDCAGSTSIGIEVQKAQ